MYAPLQSRLPTRSHIVHATAEFRRLLDASNSDEERECGRDICVTLATDVSLQQWLQDASSIDTSGATIDVTLKNKAAATDASAATADLVVTKLTDSKAHAAVVSEVKRQLGAFAGASGNLVTVEAQDSDSSSRVDLLDGELRHPDVVLRPASGNFRHKDARVIVEVEMENRSVPALHAWCKGYFRHPLVRHVVALKFFPVRRQSLDAPGEFAALTLQYGRLAPAFNDDDQSCVLRAVSFGTAKLLGKVAKTMPESVQQCFAVLPHLTPQEAESRHNPWTPSHHHHASPVLTIPYDDCMYGGGPDPSHLNNLVAGATPDSPPLEVDLFRVLNAYATSM